MMDAEAKKKWSERNKEFNEYWNKLSEEEQIKKIEALFEASGDGMTGFYQDARANYDFSDYLAKNIEPTKTEKARAFALIIENLQYLHDEIVKERHFAIAKEIRNILEDILEKMKNLLEIKNEN